MIIWGVSWENSGHIICYCGIAIIRYTHLSKTNNPNSYNKSKLYTLTKRSCHWTGKSIVAKSD